MNDTVSRTDILLAEDEAAIREALVALLEGEGYSVRAAADGEEALRLFAERRPDLVVLDVRMPKRNGYAVCAEIREKDRALPIVFLTVQNGDEEELRGLTVGADDYIVKTSSIQVILARIAAALARVRRFADPDTTFMFADCRVDAIGLCLTRPDKQVVELTLREVEMLRCFVRNKGAVLSRDYLFTKFWGRTFVGDESTLSVAMRRLREKLGSASVHIETVYGGGYRFVD